MTTDSEDNDEEDFSGIYGIMKAAFPPSLVRGSSKGRSRGKSRTRGSSRGRGGPSTSSSGSTRGKGCQTRGPNFRGSARGGKA